jgi:YidC/Oxa1 family membrane protein insertase
MDFLYNVLGYVFGPIMRGIFVLVHNYGLAIIFFTIFCRLLTLPTAVGQQKNQAKNARMQLKLRKIQEKYKDDKQRLQKETQEFYSREGYNPMSAGCSGGMLLQFPIMFGLLAAIYRPLKYALNIPPNVLAELEKQAPKVLTAAGQKVAKGNTFLQLNIIQHLDKFKVNGAFTAQWHEKIAGFVDQFKFLGLNLGATPKEGGSVIYYAIPVLAGAAAMATSLYTYFHTRKQNPQQQQNAAMMGCTTFGMPLFSAYLALSFPVGIGIYWVISSLLQFIQMAVLNLTHPPQKMLAKVLVDETIERRSREMSRKKTYELQRGQTE